MAETATADAPTTPAEGEPGAEATPAPPAPLAPAGPRSYEYNDDGKLVETVGDESRVLETPETGSPEPPSKDAGDEKPADGAEPKGEAEKPPEPKPEGDAGETQPPALDDATLNKLLDDKDFVERLAKAKPLQDRIERLAANRAGNLLQERRKADEAWQKSADYNRRLLEDDAFYEQQVEQYGEPAILEWRANFMKAEKQRQESPDAGPEQIDPAKFAEEFSNGAIKEFQTIVAALPIGKDLPEETQKQLSELRFDPEGNWFYDAMQSLGKAVEDRIAAVQKQAEKDIEEAREAGRNEARAEREEGRPVRVNGSVDAVLTDPERVIREYGAGQGDWTREDFHKARKQLHQTW